MNKKGFTVVELLSTIFVMAILTTILFVLTGPAREKTRNNKRVSDMQQLYEALGLYMIDNHTYPSVITAGQPLTGANGVTYLKEVPANPTPYTDGTCASDSAYQYTQDASGASYHVSFCLGKPVSGHPAGYNTVFPDGIMPMSTYAAVCIPSCGVAVCGDDGCGGSCGTCGEGLACSEGSCACVPNCGSAVCGDDGCGGSCGSCLGRSPTAICSSGACIADTQTVLMLHMNGTDNAQVFTDSSSGAKTATVSGNTKTENTQSKFGGTSAYFDGSGDYLTFLDSDDWYFGTGDFTIDLWVNFAASPAGQNKTIMSQVQSAGSTYLTFRLGTVAVGPTCNLNGEGKISGVTIINSYAYSGTIDSLLWHHIAIVRYGSVLNYYLDGVNIGQTTPAISFGNISAVLRIGTLTWGSPLQFFYGYIDELRISKGVARWTTNFTPPTEEY